MFVENVHSAVVDQNDVIEAIQNQGVGIRAVSNGMCFTLTLHLLWRYLEELKMIKKPDVYTLYQRMLVHCQKRGEGAYCQSLVNEFKHYIFLRKKIGADKKEKIMKKAIKCLAGKRLRTAQIERKNPADAARKIADWLEKRDCVVLVCMEAEEAEHTIALISSSEKDCRYLQHLDLCSQTRELKMQGEKEAGCIQLESYLIPVLSKWELPLKTMNIACVTYARIKYKKSLSF